MLDNERPYWRFRWIGATSRVQGAQLLERREEIAATRGAGFAEIAETLDEFRYSALCIRDLVTAARIVTGELEPAEASWQSPVWEPPHQRYEDFPWISDEQRDGPAALLGTELTEALQPFAPTVHSVLAWVDGPYRGEPQLYSRCCLELFNHLAEHATYRKCANETCGRLFVRQSGRARFDQHRTSGVRFCSATCARAQRDHRRRRRQAR